MKKAVYAAGWALALSSCLDPSEPGNLVPPTTVEAPELAHWEMRDGVQLHYKTAGNPADTALIILHGGPGGDYEGYLGLEPLAQWYYVIWFDQRSSGQSERLDHTEIDPADYVADVHEIGNRVSPDRPFMLLGHSWGGALAAWYASEHGERLAKLLLVEPGALYPDAAKVANTTEFRFSAAGIHRFLATQAYIVPKNHALADYYFANINEADIGDDRDFFDPSERALLRYRRFGFHANLAVNSWQGNFDQKYTFDVRDGLETFAAPVLILAGTHSRRLGLDFQQTYHAPLFREVTLAPVENAGHFMIETHPQLVLAALVKFLGRVP